MYVQTFSVVVSQVKPGSQGLTMSSSSFWKSPKGSLISVYKPVCWFCLHMVTSQSLLAPAPCVSAQKLGGLTETVLKSMPCGAISRCLKVSIFKKKHCPVLLRLFTDRCRPGPTEQGLTGTSPSAPLPGPVRTYPRL